MEKTVSNRPRLGLDSSPPVPGMPRMARPHQHLNDRRASGLAADVRRIDGFGFGMAWNWEISPRKAWQHIANIYKLMQHGDVTWCFFNGAVTKNSRYGSVSCRFSSVLSKDRERGWEPLDLVSPMPKKHPNTSEFAGWTPTFLSTVVHTYIPTFLPVCMQLERFFIWRWSSQTWWFFHYLS